MMITRYGASAEKTNSLPFFFLLSFLSILGDIGVGAFVRSRQLINNSIYFTKA